MIRRGSVSSKNLQNDDVSLECWEHCLVSSDMSFDYLVDSYLQELTIIQLVALVVVVGLGRGEVVVCLLAS